MGERFVVEGEIPGVFSSSRVLELRVFDDGTLSGCFLDLAQDGEGSYATLMHGTAVRRKQGFLGDFSTRARVCDVRFQLAKTAFESGGPVTLFTVFGTLSSSSGLVAQCCALAKTYGFILSIQEPKLGDQHAVAGQSSSYTLRSLVPGVYTLKGAAIGKNKFLYPAKWVLNLRAGGQLEGSSTEGDRVSFLDGLWSSTDLHFTLSYGRVKTKAYTYNGNAHAAGLRGQWKLLNVERHSAQDCGTFDFALVDACRQWSHGSHKHFPKEFRDTVLLCLMSSMQASEATGKSNVAAPRLPSQLWSEVFSYCEYHWFRVAPEAQKTHMRQIDASNGKERSCSVSSSALRSSKCTIS